MVLGTALGAWFIVLAIRRQQIVTPAGCGGWQDVFADLGRKRWRPPPTPAPITPSSAA
jgi:hypothetical protein